MKQQRILPATVTGAAAGGDFREAAEAAGRAEYVRFADQLATHARQEEEILYPAAVLVGRYVAQTALK